MLLDAGYEIIENPYGRPMTLEERLPYLADISAVVAGADDWGEEIFARAPHLKVIARFGVGVDQVDLAAAKAHGIKVANARGANADSVAEFALAGMLSVLRNVVGLDRSTRAGGWDRFVGHTLRGKRVGLVGFGAIAQYLARLLSGFQVEVVCYDLVESPAAAELHVTYVSLDELLRTSDVISLHVPGTEQTRHLIDAAALEKMKPNAVLVNTARGSVVDESALYRALTQHRICGAALDVHATEPSSAEDPLYQLDNVVVFPHTAAETYETYHAIGILTAQIVLDVLERNVPPANWLDP